MASNPQIGAAATSAATTAWWRDRGARLTVLPLLLLAALAWFGVVRQALQMEMAMPGGMVSVGEAAGFVLAWGVMMAAMMLPSATPMFALYRSVSRNLSRSGQHVAPTAVFVATYLVVWLLFGVPVYLASAAVAALAGASSSLARWLPYALALVLVAAGAYQFTALKRVCLKHCQTPLAFLMSRWRSGYLHTLRLALAHAAYCVGCCWGLMVVLVAAGAMSLPWVLLIAAAVSAEKLLPASRWIAPAAGAVLVLLGAAVAVNPALAPALRGQPMP